MHCSIMLSIEVPVFAPSTFALKLMRNGLPSALSALMLKFVCFSKELLSVPYLVTTVYQGDCDKIRTKNREF